MKAIRFHEFGAPEVLRYEDAPLAVASSRHEAFLRELGADEFIDYTQTKPEDDVRDVDLVVDAVGGPAASRFLQTIRPGGALFPIFPSALPDMTRLPAGGDRFGDSGSFQRRSVGQASSTTR